MDALLLALLLTLSLDQRTATQAMVARFANRGRSEILWAGGLALVIGANAVIAAVLGGVMAALLMPDARLLFLAIALLIAGIGQIAGSLNPMRPLSDGAPGRSLRTLTTIALRRAGENGAFATAGVAAFTDAPILAGVGAMLGGWAALVPVLALGQRYQQFGTLRILQFLSGCLLLCAGIACTATALHLVG